MNPQSSDYEDSFFPADPNTTADYEQALAWAEQAVLAVERYSPSATQSSPNAISAEALRRIHKVSDHAFAPSSPISQKNIPDTIGLGHKVMWELPGRRTDANIVNSIAWARVAVARAVAFASTENGHVTCLAEPRESRRWWMEQSLDNRPGKKIAESIMHEAEQSYESAALYVQSLSPDRSDALQPMINELHAQLRRIEPVRA